MFDDDDIPLKKTAKVKDLTDMSISELEEYIAVMRDEIIRVEADIAKKKAHQESLDSFFKT